MLGMGGGMGVPGASNGPGGGLLGGMGLDFNMSNMPVIGSFVQNPAEQHLQEQMQRMGQVYQAYRPEATQAQLNAMRGTLQALDPYNSAMSMMYGGQFQQLPQVTSPISPYGHGLGSPNMPGGGGQQGGGGLMGGAGMLGGLGGLMGGAGDMFGGILGGAGTDLGGLAEGFGGGLGGFAEGFGGGLGGLAEGFGGGIGGILGGAMPGATGMLGKAASGVGDMFSNGLSPRGAKDPGLPKGAVNIRGYDREGNPIYTTDAKRRPDSSREPWESGEVNWG